MQRGCQNKVLKGCTGLLPTFTYTRAQRNQHDHQDTHLTFEQRISLCEQDLRIKGTQMKEIEPKMARMEVYVDQLEQYSRRTSVRISGVQESEWGEDLTTVVTDILANTEYYARHASANNGRRKPRPSRRTKEASRSAHRATKTSQADLSLSSSFPFVRGEVLPATFSPPHLTVFSTLLCLLSSSSSLPPLLSSSNLS